MVFFSYVGEESEGTQLNKGRFRARSTTAGQLGDKKRLRNAQKNKKPAKPELNLGKTTHNRARPQISLRKTTHQGSTYSADPYAENPQES